MDSDDALLEATLTFAGTYVSDDGKLRITRASGGTGYVAARFVGYCDACDQTGQTLPAGEPLADIPAAVLFAAAHIHGDED